MMTDTCCAMHKRSSFISRSRYDPTGLWYPRADPALLGEISQWLTFADGVTATASAARLHDGMFYALDVEAARAGAHRLFRILDEHLWFGEQEGRDWLCSPAHPTIADVACFPYIMLSEEGGIPRQDYPAIRRWCDRVQTDQRFCGDARDIPGITCLGCLGVSLVRINR